MRNVRLMFPLKVEFELTKKCNLSCNHCMIKNIEVESSHKEELSTDEIKKTIDYLNKKNIIEIQFTGGEPFFRKDLPDIAKYVDKKKIKVLISSNGTIISEEVAKKLSSCNFLSVEISIDGDEKNHDNIRGNGSYNKAIRGIEILRRYRIPVMIETVVNKNNFVNIPFIYTLSKKLGAYRYVVHNLRLLGNAIENKDNLLPTIDQLIGVQNYLIQKSKNNGIQIK
ncbi:MAG: radical SAM protein, partial [Candidatus Odinarchaeota archaeon]